MSSILYKKGYLVKISTWENDADNRNVGEIWVSTEKEVQEVVAFASLFKSRHNGGGGADCIGNMYEPDEAENTQITAAFRNFHETHPNFGEPVGEVLTDEDLWDIYFSVAYDLTLTGGEFLTRVCDKIEVMYIHEDVVYEDLTEKFVKKWKS